LASYAVTAAKLFEFYPYLFRYTEIHKDRYPKQKQKDFMLGRCPEDWAAAFCFIKYHGRQTKSYIKKIKAGSRHAPTSVKAERPEFLTEEDLKGAHSEEAKQLSNLNPQTQDFINRFNEIEGNAGAAPDEDETDTPETPRPSTDSTFHKVLEVCESKMHQWSMKAAINADVSL
jgi:hypothetical protein